jgi:integrase/recombinase XerD
MTRTSASRQHKREPLSEEEANRLANACETADEKLVIWTLLDTGLRVAEFCSIEKQNLDWQSHALRIIGKGAKPRVVHLSHRVIPLIEHHISDNDRILLNIRKVQRIVRKVANRAGIMRATSPHVLRHTFAVLSLKKGIILPVLQKALGHERMETTGIYLNMSGADVLKEYGDKW